MYFWSQSLKSIMKIFISWSGERSQKIAEAFRHWMPEVIQSVHPYFTPDDVVKGQRWAADIAENLHTSQFGLFCLTAENLAAPWLLFEAGAVSKDSRNGTVCPLLFGVDSAQLAGPLLQFQATPYSKEEVFKFMKTVNSKTSVPLTDVQLARAFNRCWNELDEKIQAVLSSDSQGQAVVPRSQKDMLEEMLSIVRTISLFPSQAANDEQVNHWLVLLQSTLDFSNDTLRLAENNEQAFVLDQLQRQHDYVKIVANLIIPKIKSTKAGSNYLAQAKKLLAQMEERINMLAIALDENSPF